MGIGREALEMLEDALRRRGIRELRTGVGAGDSRRQQLLLSLGFVPLDERKHIALDRGRVMIALFRKELGDGGGVNG
jgi:ribosomal protein S18 acetylase RimI-like enzyme